MMMTRVNRIRTVVKKRKRNKRGGSTIVNIYHQSINIYFPDMIDIQDFIKNLQTVNPLTPVQTQGINEELSTKFTSV